MESYNYSSFESNNIFAMSDIHGDFSALIINLRDLAQCIKYTDSVEKNHKLNYWIRKASIDLPDFLLDSVKALEYLSKSVESDIYDPLNGFKWIGNNKTIIITGDIIDNIRPGYVPDRFDITKRQGEIKHEEIKILLFLQALNYQAMKEGGKIIILLGNHDLFGILGNNGYRNYRSEYCNSINYQTHSREIYFNKLSYLFMNNGLFMIICKINNCLFMHGGLNSYVLEQILRLAKISYKKVDEYIYDISDIMHFINKQFTSILKKIIDKTNLTSNEVELYNILMNDSNDYEVNPDYDATCNVINKVDYNDQTKNNFKKGILFTRLIGNEHITDNYCGIISDLIRLLCNNILNHIEYCEGLDFIVGHCVQHMYQCADTCILSKSDTDVHNEIFYTRSGNPEKIKYINPTINDKIPGITVTKCTLESDTHQGGHIFRIDTSMSRAFDIQCLTNIDECLKHLSARSPQILNITRNITSTIIDQVNKFKIIKSTLLNTFYSQIRDNSLIYDSNNIDNILKSIEKIDELNKHN
jgi:hypothetical protein